jgi:hypothetical protein
MDREQRLDPRLVEPRDAIADATRPLERYPGGGSRHDLELARRLGRGDATLGELGEIVRVGERGRAH